MIVHIAFEVSDLARSARFYDAIFHALGARRMFETDGAIAYGRDQEQVWIVARGRAPGPGYGHMGWPPPAAPRSTAPTSPVSPAAAATTAPRARARSTARTTTRAICWIRTACAWSSRPARAERGERTISPALRRGGHVRRARVLVVSDGGPGRASRRGIRADASPNHM